MRTAAWIATALLAAAACKQNPSPLDEVKGDPLPALPSGDLEGRIARLEKLERERADMMKWLGSVYERQVEAETKAQPGVVYGVDIAPDIALGQVEGSPEALVTIVEAWDFA